jgi:hypothetical protein
MKKITLSVTPESAQDILRVLGQLPTSSGAYPLLVDLKKQYDEQVQQDSQQEEAQLPSAPNAGPDLGPTGQPKVINQLFDAGA